LTDTTRIGSDRSTTALFVSRASADAAFAAVIAAILQDAGYDVILQQWDFANKNFMEAMHAALAGGARVVALLSPEYLASDHCRAEWQNAIARDPLNTQSRLVLLRVAECEPIGLLSGLAYWDLVPIRADRELLRQTVLEAVSDDRPPAIPAGPYWREPRSAADARPDNLPHPISSFVGREKELADLRTALHDRRVVTIAGMGGMGKTRVAVQLASEAISDFPDGAWFVDLSAIADASLIDQTIARALDVRESAHEPLRATLLRYLHDRHALLLFDNAEHLLVESADCIRAIASSCARMSIVATSREPLHVTGEYVYRIGPLANAEQLFAERTLEVGAAADAPSDLVEALCRKLDGIPLAIELAAARTTVLSLEQLNRRLEQDIGLLASRGSANARHRTLDATIDWSYQLLDASERRLFESLSIFVDGFTLDASEALATTLGDGTSTLDTLQSLVEKSLVTLSRTPLGPRYQMLDTIVSFARERRFHNADLREVPREHFDFFLGLVESYQHSGEAQARSDWMRAVTADMPNCRAALTWAIENREQRAGELACALATYWQTRGSFSEGRAWLKRYLEAFDETNPSYLRALRFAAFFAASQNDFDEARSLSERTLAIAKDRGDALMRGEALHALAAVEQRLGEHQKAASLYGEALGIFEATGNIRNTLVALLNLANLQADDGAANACTASLEKIEELNVQIKDADFTAITLGIRGTLALRLNHLDEAQTYIEEALAMQTALGSARRIDDLNSLAEVRVRQGGFKAAYLLATESIALSFPIEDHSSIIRSLELLAVLAFGEGGTNDALACVCAADEMRARFNYQSQRLSEIVLLRGALKGSAPDRYRAIAERNARSDWRAIVEAIIANQNGFTKT